MSLALAILVVVLEFFYYPEAATFINDLIGNRAAPGSSMGYFRTYYVLPASAVFLLLSLLLVGGAAAKGHRTLHAAVVVLTLVNIVALSSSALWYFRTIEGAASATSP